MYPLNLKLLPKFSTQSEEVMHVVVSGAKVHLPRVRDGGSLRFLFILDWLSSCWVLWMLQESPPNFWGKLCEFQLDFTATFTEPIWWVYVASFRTFWSVCQGTTWQQYRIASGVKWHRFGFVLSRGLSLFSNNRIVWKGTLTGALLSQ